MADDIGLTWLAAQCDDLEDLPPEELDCLAEQGPVAAVLRVAERTVTDLGRTAALQLGRDVRRLLDSPLPDETLRTVWLGATDNVFDPAKDGISSRTWLRRIEEAWLAAERRGDPTFVAPPADPVTDEELRQAVVRTIQSVVGDLTNAVENRTYPLPLPGLVPALEQVALQSCADLGYRLFLRALKASFLEIDKHSHAAFIALGERLGHPTSLVDHGLNIRQ
ncbi:hypothetical protein [Streptomyces sp. NPDC059861]|uniref:hypothetical protein n=1 Tax=Streptomyces sp. NPDC059861 TaxID=3346974 RepID=UPI0036628AEE